MTDRFEGKVVLVSGAARGQGADEARRFRAEGARVVVGDVLEGELAALAADLGDSARSLRLDVTVPDEWDAAVRMASEEFGGLDVLVNNAGIALPTPIVGGDVDDFVRVVMVNQVGVYLGMRAVAPTMKERGGGAIVNISSIDGMIGMPFVSGYVSSKFGVRGLTRAAALELADAGIRVNSVHPGYIDTPMLREPVGEQLMGRLADSVPLRRLGTTADVAELVLFLASDQANYCSGSEFVVDGGLIAGLPVSVFGS